MASEEVTYPHDMWVEPESECDYCDRRNPCVTFHRRHGGAIPPVIICVDCLKEAVELIHAT